MKNKKRFVFCINKNAPRNEHKYYIKDDFSFWHFASFDNLDQVKKFFKKFNIKILSTKDKGWKFRSFVIDKSFEDVSYFWDKKDLPTRAKKIKALSNGSVVDCFYTETKNKIRFFRPNPNAKDVYKPLSIFEHIAYSQKNGIF